MAQKNLIEIAKTENKVLCNFDGAQIDCGGPDEFLYQFNGNIRLTDGNVYPLGPNNLVLKGTKLLNTKYIYGICVYSGHETKMMKNSAPARSKKSDVEIKMNKFIIYLILF